MTEDLSKGIEQLSFEQALGKLEEIVAALDRGQLPLEESVHLFEQGNLLRIHCEKKLAEAKLRIDKVIQSTQDGQIELEPFFKKEEV